MLSLPSSVLFHRILARQRTASFGIGLLPSPLLDLDEDAGADSAHLFNASHSSLWISQSAF